MVEISRSVERRYILGLGTAGAEDGGVDRGCHDSVSRAKRVDGIDAAIVDAPGRGGCAGACWPLALAASSHFSRVLWSTGHLAAGSAASGGISMDDGGVRVKTVELIETAKVYEDRIAHRGRKTPRLCGNATPRMAVYLTIVRAMAKGRCPREC
jgi:hypothetical protein